MTNSVTTSVTSEIEVLGVVVVVVVVVVDGVTVKRNNLSNAF